MFVTSLIMLLMMLASCSGDNPTTVAPPTPDDVVVANALLIQDLAEAYAAENDGKYPPYSNINSSIPDLPLLENPYTGRMTEPRRNAAVCPGEIWYRPTIDHDGYLISGAGGSTEVVLLYRNYPEVEIVRIRAVVANCVMIARAAEQFAIENNGIYPNNVDGDETAGGKTMTDFLPGGHLLENPYSYAATEPVDGVPTANPGETGYAPVTNATGQNVGYNVSGHGKYAVVVRLGYDSGHPDYLKTCLLDLIGPPFAPPQP